MSIEQLLRNYIQQGYRTPVARNLAAQEIVLTKIANSDMAQFITLKGGIVMFNLSGNKRRATKDVDFDFIRYSLSEPSIRMFVDKLNAVGDEFFLEIEGKPEALHQEDYRGVRLDMRIKDGSGASLQTKIDIGVHNRADIVQDRLTFAFGAGKRFTLLANSPEQIFAEKTMSLARLRAISTRYRDVYDICFLIQSGLNLQRLRAVLFPMILRSKKQPTTVKEYKESIIATLRNPSFAKGCEDVKNRWLDLDYATMTAVIESVLRSI